MKFFLSAFALLIGSLGSLSAQSDYGNDGILGTWKAVDHDDNMAKAYLKIYKKNGRYHAKIVDLLQRPDDTVCPKCPGAKQNQPLVGMTIVDDLKPYKDYWSYGQILDPEDGKTYKCNVYLESRDKIRLRAYVGIPAVGQSQYWYRVK